MYFITALYTRSKGKFNNEGLVREKQVVLHKMRCSMASAPDSPLSRRLFLRGLAAAGPVAAAQPNLKNADESGSSRADQAYQIRLNAAQIERDAPAAAHPNNGDEELYPSRIGNYSKGLPHNDFGEVDANAYTAFLHALSTAHPADFESIPMGSADPALQRKFVNPQAGMAFNLEGADPQQLAIAPAPAFGSAEQAADTVELYWQALARDVPFSEYGSNPITQAAAAELSRLSGFQGPKSNGRVDATTLFRGLTAGDTVGPYLSQFLVKGIPFGVQYVEQKMLSLLPGIDYMTGYAEWLYIQNGSSPKSADRIDQARCYIRNGRDMAQWVHIDVLFQAYFNAMLMMIAAPDANDKVTGGGMKVPLNPANPYLRSGTQQGFGTFGEPEYAAATASIATSALKAVWYQKWLVHRRLRPEAFGGAVHNHLTNRRQYSIHGDILNSAAVAQVFSKFGTYLLPQAFPEGSPLHPSYGAGHATVAGACVTMLKALFDESFVIPNPVMPGPDGVSLIPYTGPDADRLTVGGELNKLAANVGIGRNFAGIHYRSDYTQSLRLGETVAISALRDRKLTYNEEFEGFSFTRFDGTKITI
jgi:hypothetical protein